MIGNKNTYYTFKEFLKCKTLNDNKNNTCQNQWDSAKTALNGKCTVISPYFLKIIYVNTSGPVHEH